MKYTIIIMDEYVFNYIYIMVILYLDEYVSICILYLNE